MITESENNARQEKIQEVLSSSSTEEQNIEDSNQAANEIPSDYEPEIIYKDEIMYALGNIIQNAIFYSVSFIKVQLNYQKLIVTIIITDDGNGFSKDIIDKLGEPYVSKNKNGMGLGIFIAKNLIENIGGSIAFNNNKNKGAKVEIKIFRVT